MKRIALVTDRRLNSGRPLVELLAEAAGAGVDQVQIREKDLPAGELLALTRAAVAACRPHGCRVFVNGRFDVALAAGADGVHLPADGLRVEQVRARTGGRLAIGVSTHSVAEARAAGLAGADFVFLGPVFATPSKARYGPPLGLDDLARAASALDVPVWAIGGIDVSTAGRFAGVPIAGVAVIRALLGAPHIAAAVGELRDQLADEEGEGSDVVLMPGEDEAEESGGAAMPDPDPEDENEEDAPS